MAKYKKDKKGTIYDSYQDYITIQDERYHNYDCPNCLQINKFNITASLRVNSNISSILDIGSRDSAYFDEFNNKGIDCTGIDISPRSVEYALSKNRNVVLGDAKDIVEIFNEKKFDLIISCHTLEHFLEPEKTIKGCWDLLNENGLILIRLPDEGKVLNDPQKLMAHVRLWTRGQVRSLLTDNGFVIVKERLDLPKEIFLIGRKKKRVAKIDDFTLFNVPNNKWESKYNEVIKDSYIQRKYNRKRRLQDKIDYVKFLSPEIKNQKGLVLDIGPGPGEFLEVCRYYGNKVQGIDSVLEENLMGLEYLNLSILMTERQKIKVDYIGFENMLKNKLLFKDESVTFVNFQGSIEQIFCKHISGDMTSKNYANVHWKMDNEMDSDFSKMFLEIKRILKPGGIFLVFANGTGNTDEYFKFMNNKIIANGFERLSVPKEYERYWNKIHKMKK